MKKNCAIWRLYVFGKTAGMHLMKERNSQENIYSCAARATTQPRKCDPGLLFLAKELVDEKAFFLVCQALANADDQIAIGAALVLGHMRDVRAVSALLRALITTDQKRAEAIMWSLGEIGDDAAIPFLLKALRANFIPKSALIALGKIGSPDAVEGILASLTNEDEAVRLLAVKAIGQIQFGNYRDLLFKASQSLAAHLEIEESRRVKLLLAVVKGRLEHNFEH